MNAAAWYCIRSKVKQEHVAAGRLRQLPGVEVFAPRLRFQRPTRRGPVWFVEALFPGYLFAKFDWQAQVKAVQYAYGVLGLVHFGAKYAVVPEAAVNELRRYVDEHEVRIVSRTLNVGDEARVVSGPMAGLMVVVEQLLPACERIRVLLDFLGRRVTAELAVAELATDWKHPLQKG